MDTVGVAGFALAAVGGFGACTAGTARARAHAAVRDCKPGSTESLRTTREAKAKQAKLRALLLCPPTVGFVAPGGVG